MPHELLVTDDNLVYVMDRENHRWQVFTTEGAFVSLQEHVSHPNRVALDADGTFHIAGGAGIESWKRDGTKIGSWGEKGEAPGQFVAGSVHGAWMDTICSASPTRLLTCPSFQNPMWSPWRRLLAVARA